MDVKKTAAAGFESGKLFRGEFSPIWKLIHSITKVHAGKDAMRPMLAKVLVERDTVTYNAGQTDETTGPLMRAIATDLHRLIIVTFKPGENEPLPLLDAGLYDFVVAPSPSAGVLLRAFEGDEKAKNYPDYRRVLPETEEDWGDVIGTYSVDSEREALRLDEGQQFGMNLRYLPDIRDMNRRDENSKDERVRYLQGWTIQRKGDPFRFVGYWRGVRIDYICMRLAG